jgi:hypothetical protein
MGPLQDEMPVWTSAVCPMYSNKYSSIYADIFGRFGSLSFFLRNRSDGMITSIKEEGRFAYSFANHTCLKESIEFQAMCASDRSPRDQHPK